MHSKLATAKKPERRGVARQACGTEPVSVAIFSGVHPREAAVYNISARGMALRLDHPVDPGQHLSIGLLNRSGNYWHLKVLRVIHATPCARDAWLVGGEFLERFPEAELSALQGPCSAAS